MQLQPGQAIQGTKVDVAAGPIDNGSRNELVISSIDGSNRHALMVYKLTPNNQGQLQFERIRDKRQSGQNPAIAMGNLQAERGHEILVAYGNPNRKLDFSIQRVLD